MNRSKTPSGRLTRSALAAGCREVFDNGAAMLYMPNARTGELLTVTRNSILYRGDNLQQARKAFDHFIKQARA